MVAHESKWEMRDCSVFSKACLECASAGLRKEKCLLMLRHKSCFGKVRKRVRIKVDCVLIPLPLSLLITNTGDWAL